MKSALIVDDSRAIRMVARRILEQFGFEVSEVETVERAVEVCAEKLPDLVLANWYMMGARWLADLIRRNARRQPTKLVVLVVENDPLDTGKALRAGADAFLLKPFTRETLEAVLDEVGALADRVADAARSDTHRPGIVAAAIVESSPDHIAEAERDGKIEKIPSRFGRRSGPHAAPSRAGL
jgi:two-component system chemotaxis response regulator CheY